MIIYFLGSEIYASQRHCFRCHEQVSTSIDLFAFAVTPKVQAVDASEVSGKFYSICESWPTLNFYHFNQIWVIKEKASNPI